MQQIKYGDSSFTLRLEFPEHWDTESITGVTVAVTTRGNSSLLAAQDATIYTATTLGAAASAGDAYVTLAEGADAPSPGDIMIIAASDDGDRERIVVSHYDSVNRYLYPEDYLESAHSSGAAVYGAYATYALDASSATNYPKTAIVVVTWTPDSDDTAVTEEYVVAATSMAGGGLWADLSNSYPTVYEKIAGRDKDRLEDVIRSRFGNALRHRGLDINRVKDQTLLSDGMVLFARFIILSDSSVENETYMRAKTEFKDWLDMLAASPIWQDFDQDGAEDGDTGEVQPHYIENLYRVI
jgi:hypothetical protein